MRVLIYGDSQAAGPPGQALERLLRETGARVTRMGFVGKGPADLIEGQGWDLYLSSVSAFVPDVIVLMFGSNDLANQRLKSAMDRFRDSATVVWYAGPPRYNRDAALQQRGSAIRDLAKSVFKSRYIDAWPVTGPSVPRRADGVHFGPEGGAVWARSIMSSLTGKVRVGVAVMLGLAVGIAGIWWAIRSR